MVPVLYSSLFCSCPFCSTDPSSSPPLKPRCDSRRTQRGNPFFAVLFLSSSSFEGLFASFFSSVSIALVAWRGSLSIFQHDSSPLEWATRSFLSRPPVYFQLNLVYKFLPFFIHLSFYYRHLFMCVFLPSDDARFGQGTALVSRGRPPCASCLTNIVSYLAFLLIEPKVPTFAPGSHSSLFGGYGGDASSATTLLKPQSTVLPHRRRCVHSVPLARSLFFGPKEF